MKIRSLKMNNHKKAFEVRTYKDTYEYPYALLDCNTAEGDTIVNACVDPELGNEAFTCEPASGVEDSIHIVRSETDNANDATPTLQMIIRKQGMCASSVCKSAP